VATAKKPAPKTAQTKKTVKKAPARKAAVAKKPIAKKAAVKKTTAKPKGKTAAAKTVKPKTLVGKVHHHIKRAFQAGSIKTIAIVGVLFLATVVGVGAYYKLGASASTAVKNGKYLSQFNNGAALVKIDSPITANAFTAWPRDKTGSLVKNFILRDAAGKAVTSSEVASIGIGDSGITGVRWSYRGDKVYLKTMSLSGYPNNTYSLYQANSDGTGAKRIYTAVASAANTYILDFVVARDNSKVVMLPQNTTKDNVLVWDASTNKTTTVKLAKAANTFSSSMVPSPDGKYIAIGENNAIAVYDLVTMKKVAITSGFDECYTGRCTILGWNEQGVIYKDVSSSTNTIRISAAPITTVAAGFKASQLLYSSTKTGSGSSAAIYARILMSRDGAYVAYADTSGVTLINLKTKVIKSLTGVGPLWSKDAQGLAFTPDSSAIVYQNLGTSKYQSYNLTSKVSTNIVSPERIINQDAWQGITY